jgi:DNA polymerase III delta subunit
LANAIGEQNTAEALHLLENFLDGGNHPAIALKMIVRHYSILSLAMIELDKGNSVEKIAQVVGVHLFFARSYTDQARSFTQDEIFRCLSIVKDADRQVRSLGKRLERISMDQMVVRLCGKTFL